jgi:ATP-dependent RNA helicase RhlE
MAIHGNKSQSAREKALGEFKAGRLRVLVATDIAARGIDIDALPHVVNYELPNTPEDYVHRIGRTGRAGMNGEAVSLVCVDELKLLADIEKLMKRKLTSVVIPGFEPDPNAVAEPLRKPRPPLNARAPKGQPGKPASSRPPANRQGGSGKPGGGKPRFHSSGSRG